MDIELPSSTEDSCPLANPSVVASNNPTISSEPWRNFNAKFVDSRLYGFKRVCNMFVRAGSERTSGLMQSISVNEGRVVNVIFGPWISPSTMKILSWTRYNACSLEVNHLSPEEISELSRILQVMIETTGRVQRVRPSEMVNINPFEVGSSCYYHKRRPS